MIHRKLNGSLTLFLLYFAGFVLCEMAGFANFDRGFAYTAAAFVVLGVLCLVRALSYVT